MGSIIEMAARNELLRRDGRHTAHEFLDKVEGHLAMRPAIEGHEAEAGADRREGEGAGESESRGPATWSTLVPGASGAESSAWIPAARPRKEGEE
jgi:hypothetical protein